MDCEGTRLLLEGLIMKPKDSRKSLLLETISAEVCDVGATKIMSSSHAEFLIPSCLMDDKGTFSNLVKIRGAQERPNTKAIKQ